MLYLGLPAADITLSLLLCRRGPPAVKNLARCELEVVRSLMTGNADVAKPWAPSSPSQIPLSSAAVEFEPHPARSHEVDDNSCSDAESLDPLADLGFVGMD